MIGDQSPLPPRSVKKRCPFSGQSQLLLRPSGQAAQGCCTGSGPLLHGVAARAACRHCLTLMSSLGDMRHGFCPAPGTEPVLVVHRRTAPLSYCRWPTSPSRSGLSSPERRGVPVERGAAPLMSCHPAGRAAGQALRRVGTADRCRCGAGRAGAARAPALMASVALRSASSISSWEAYPAKYGWMK